MAITVQALQADGTWAVRNAFTTENARVISGSMSAADLDAKARRLMGQWQQTAPDGKQLRVHNSANDPKPLQRKRSEQSGEVFTHSAARADACNHDFQGWREIDGGRGGEQVCTKCGMGAMHHSLMMAD